MYECMQDYMFEGEYFLKLEMLLNLALFDREIFFHQFK
jgi:hypothetical protein